MVLLESLQDILTMARLVYVPIAFEPVIEEGYKFENLKNNLDNSDPFTWKEDTITLLNEELKQSDALVLTLLDELEELKEQVVRS